MMKKLEIGYKATFEVRKEIYVLPINQNLKVLYLSDLHLNRFSPDLVHQLCLEIKNLSPDIILLGGDYVDTQKGLVPFEILLNALSFHKHIFAIAGNHDQWFGLEKLHPLFLKNNIVWLEQQSIVLEIKGLKVRIDGNLPLLAPNSVDVSILCLHKPIDLSKYGNNYHLALAGHLHGCQFVFWRNIKGLFPGRIFYRWNILKTRIGTCLYLISKGLGDTLPIRYNCPKDFIFVMFTPNQN
jgi:uncharacterized protein